MVVAYVHAVLSCQSKLSYPIPLTSMLSAPVTWGTPLSQRVPWVPGGSLNQFSKNKSIVSFYLTLTQKCDMIELKGVRIMSNQKVEGKMCVECGRSAPERHRKLCWSCTNYRKRYKLTYEEVQKMKDMSRTCVVCAHKTLGVIKNKQGRSICHRCYLALEILRNPEWRQRLEALC